MIQFCKKWRLQETLIDGCSLGVKTQEGLFLKKPWRLCSNDPHIDLVFRKYKCSNRPGSHDNHEHGECRGVDCKNSENYSWKMVRLAHRAFRLAAQDDSIETVCTTQFFSHDNTHDDQYACDCVKCYIFHSDQGHRFSSYCAVPLDSILTKVKNHPLMLSNHIQVRGQAVPTAATQFDLENPEKKQDGTWFSMAIDSIHSETMAIALGPISSDEHALL